MNTKFDIIVIALSCAFQLAKIINMLVITASEVEGAFVSVERIKEYSEIVQEVDIVVYLH